MMATHVLTSLLGDVALLLWSIHMISTGVQRALGANLRRFLAIGLRDRWRAFGAGLVATSLLQSSTATALMVTSFTAGGAVDLVPALAVTLGANVGTTLVVQAVSFDIALVFPVLIFLGVMLYRRGRQSAVRDAATALVGLGLMLLALHLLVSTMQPVESSAALRDLFHAVVGDPPLDILLAAALSWAAHSSVAAMLFIMSLAGTGVITEPAALFMVLGANLGSAVNPIQDVLGKDCSHLRVPVGNLANRILGCLLAFPFIGSISSWGTAIGESPAHLAANFHMAFNLAMAALIIGPLPRIAPLFVWLFPESPQVADPGAPLYLDEAALSDPPVALSNAAREVLRMADAVETMLRGSQTAFQSDNLDKIVEISKTDDIIDRLYSSIHRYLGATSNETLGTSETRRVFEILALTINLEHIGDIIDSSLMALAAKRIAQQLRLSAEALSDIRTMHARVLDHLHLAIAVFMFGDAQAGRRLVGEKEHFRDIERNATQRHFDTVRTGEPSEIEASALQLDITRDLKRIEAHIAATAYGLLEQSGELRRSRLAS